MLEEYFDKMKVSYNLKFVFICGGADQNSLRYQFKEYFEANYPNNSVKLVYAENFAKVRQNYSNEDDLLSLENFITDYCDCILLFLESPGSLVEFGAFSNNPKILPKMLLVNNRKFKNDKSFINDGPVKKINAESKFKPVINCNYYYSLEVAEKIIDRIFNNLPKINHFINLKEFNFNDNMAIKTGVIVQILGLLSPVTKVEATKILKKMGVFNKDTKNNDSFFDLVFSLGWFKYIEVYIVPLKSFNSSLNEKIIKYKLYNYRAKVIKYYNKYDRKRLSYLKKGIDNHDDDYLNSILQGQNL
jgi:hypothetical protein